MSTFVSVGNANQPFMRLLEAVAVIAPSLPQPVIVQCGHAPFDSAACEVKPFVDMAEFTQLVATAELLIFHAGAGSIIHAAQAGRVPVVMPRRAALGEHIDDHQMEFAMALSESGKVILAMEPADLAAAVSKAAKQERRPSTPPALMGLIEHALAKADQTCMR